MVKIGTKRNSGPVGLDLDQSNHKNIIDEERESCDVKETWTDEGCNLRILEGLGLRSSGPKQSWN